MALRSRWSSQWRGGYSNSAIPQLCAWTVSLSEQSEPRSARLKAPSGRAGAQPSVRAPAPSVHSPSPTGPSSPGWVVWGEARPTSHRGLLLPSAIHGEAIAAALTSLPRHQPQIKSSRRLFRGTGRVRVSVWGAEPAGGTEQVVPISK